MKRKDEREQNIVCYYIVRALAWLMAIFVFRRTFVRNELRKVKGPCVVIANHEAALDFVNLIGATRRPMSFVISHAFYETLPCKHFIKRLGMIPKQQFQTSIKDVRRMKNAIRDGKILVIYPAGLMSEDGRSTPIPLATYNFLKWMNADVYVAKTSGTYFTMPKWSQKHSIRRGRTYLDVYRLFDKTQLSELTTEEIRSQTDEALLFDAYQEQELLRIKYDKNDNIEGLENVLYMCPHCLSEFTMRVRDKSVIYCSKCGYEEVSDKYAFLHNQKGLGAELRHVSAWNSMIFDALKKRVEAGLETELSSNVRIHMINRKRHKFVEVGNGTIRLLPDCFLLDGAIKSEPISLSIPTLQFASLPFKPGKYFEIQHGDTIFRCYPTDGKLAMKFINLIKIYYQINNDRISQKRCAGIPANQ